MKIAQIQTGIIPQQKSVVADKICAQKAMTLPNKNEVETQQVPTQVLQAYNGINFKGGKTNFRWMKTAAGYVPLVIAAGLDLTKGYSIAAFPGLECDGGDWENVVAEGVYMKGAKLPNSKFTRTQMQGVELHNSDLSKSRFDNAKAIQGRFSHSNFYDGYMLNSDFAQANFQKANFERVLISNSDFRNANFLGADLENVWSIDDKSVFEGALYDRDTKFPKNFSPEDRGMIMLKQDGNLSIRPGELIRSLSRVSIKPYKEEFPYILSNSDYSTVNMQEGKFENVDFDDSNFKNTDAQSSIFIGCSFSGAQFDEDSDFSGASFNKSVFFNTKFNGAILKNCNFINADLSLSDFAELPTSSVKGSVYDATTSFPENYNPEEHGMVLVEPGAKLDGIKFTGMKIRDSIAQQILDFSACKLRRADFTEAMLDNIKFKNANLHNACLKEGQMRNADFENANLFGANLIGGDFRNANFKNADLRWAKLTGANVDGADFTGAKWVKNNTLFPDGFDPNAHGMIEVKLTYL